MQKHNFKLYHKYHKQRSYQTTSSSLSTGSINLFYCQLPVDCSLGDHNSNSSTTLVVFYYRAAVRWRRVKSRQSRRDACSAACFLRRHLSYQRPGNTFPQPRDSQDASAAFCTHDPSAKRGNCRPFINVSRQARADADVFSEDGRKFSRFFADV